MYISFILISTTVRLVSPTNSSSSGRVEGLYSGTWGAICDYSWDFQDANVVYRQLGYDRGLSAPSSAAFGKGTGTIWLNDVRCLGIENLISQCSHRGWRAHCCGH